MHQHALAIGTEGKSKIGECCTCCCFLYFHIIILSSNSKNMNKKGFMWHELKELCQQGSNHVHKICNELL